MAKPTREGVDLLDTGEVRLVVDGKAVTLRRPKVGELRTMWEGLDAVTSAERTVAESGAVQPLAAAGETAAWWRTVADTLGDGGLPDDDDDFPVWLLSGSLIGRVLAHWREVPYLSGE